MSRQIEVTYMASHHQDIATVPRFVVDLDAPPAQRWSEIIAIYAQSLRAVVSQMDALIKQEAPKAGPVIASLVDAILSASCKLKVVYYHEELKAIAAAADVPLGKLTAMQLVYEAAAHCTALVVPTAGSSGSGSARGARERDGASPDDVAADVEGAAPSCDAGGLAHIRTMDWEMDFLRPLTVELELHRGGAPVAVVTTWAGYVGVLTGVALRPDPNENFSVAVNFRSVGTGTFWTNLSGALDKAWPVGFLVRETLEAATGFEQAKAWLRNSTLIAPTYITVCGVGGGCLITRERDAELHPVDLDPASSAAPQPIIQTNMDHFSDNPEESIMLSLQRRSLAKRRLAELQRRGEGVADEDLWKLMSTAPIFNEITVYGTLMRPATGFLQTRLPRPGLGFMPKRAFPAGHPGYSGAFATCTRCTQKFDRALNAPGQCAHGGTWHERYQDCSYLKCGFGLGPSNLGAQHWSCCFSTDRDSMCKKSPPHSES